MDDDANNSNKDMASAMEWSTLCNLLQMFPECKSKCKNYVWPIGSQATTIQIPPTNLQYRESLVLFSKIWRA